MKAGSLCSRWVGTFARLGPRKKQVEARERNSEAGGLYSWGLLGAPPQSAAKLCDGIQGATAFLLHSDQGRQQGHQRAQEDTQKRAPSSEETVASVSPRRHNRHGNFGLNPPFSTFTPLFLLIPPVRGGWLRLETNRVSTTRQRTCEAIQNVLREISS